MTDYLVSANLKYSAKHEQIVLGAMFSNEKTCRSLVKELDAGEFHVPRHKNLFSALQQTTEQHLKTSPSTVSTLIFEADYNVTEYIEHLKTLSVGTNLQHHIDAMRWDVARVETFEEHVPALVAELKDPSSNIDETIGLAKNVLTRLNDARSTKFIERGEALQGKYKASLMARKVGITFRSCGFMPVDKKLTTGMANGKLTVITGTPSSGKTTLALNMAMRQAKRWKVGILPWESGVQDALDIMVAAGLKIPLEKLSKLAHMLTKEEQEQIDDFIAELIQDDHLMFMKPPPNSVARGGHPWDINERVLDWVEAQLEKWNVDICYWDLFEKKMASTKPEHIVSAVNRVQDFIKPEHIGVHMVLLHQLLLKEVERRKDKRPSRDALKGSAVYIEDPDLVLGVHRPAIYEPQLEDNVLELSCMKQRKGPFPWRFIMTWNGKYGRISGGREGAIVVKEDPEEYGNGRY